MVRRRLPFQGGFSLPEIAFVLVLVGVLVALALPNLDVRRARVDAASLQLAGRLLGAQRAAVLRQHDVRVAFHLTEGSLTVHRDADNDGVVDPGEIRERVVLEDGVVFAHGGAPHLSGGSAAVTFHPDDRGDPHLVFHRNGGASEEGVVHLAPFNGGAARHARALRIERATGRARCWSHRTLAWTEGC